MIGARLIIGFARTVSGVLSAGNIMDTSIHAMTQGINIFPQILKAPIMFIVNLIVNIFITSGSGTKRQLCLSLHHWRIQLEFQDKQQYWHLTLEMDSATTSYRHQQHLWEF